MTSLKEKYGPTALIAGASEGMGAAWARALAARGLDLILIARRPGPLATTAAQIRNQSGVNVQTISCDLATPDATQQIIDATRDTPVDFLVYNAALSYIGPYLATNLSTHTGIATVNTLTPLALLHHFGGKDGRRAAMANRRKASKGIVMSPPSPASRARASWLPMPLPKRSIGSSPNPSGTSGAPSASTSSPAAPAQPPPPTI